MCSGNFSRTARSCYKITWRPSRSISTATVRHRGPYGRGARDPQEAHFFLAVCTLHDPPSSPGFLFVHQGSNVLREREKHIESLQHELLEARGQYTALHGKHEELTVHMEEQNRWALRTEEELAAARRDLTTVLENLAAAENMVIERTHWAQKLAAEVQDLGMQVEDFKGRLNLWRSSRWIQIGRKLNLGPDLDRRRPRVMQTVAAARLGAPRRIFTGLPLAILSPLLLFFAAVGLSCRSGRTFAPAPQTEPGNPSRCLLRCHRYP